MRQLGMASLVCVLVGCATAPPAPLVELPEPLPTSMATPPAIVQPLPLPPSDSREASFPRIPVSANPLQVIESANKVSLLKPSAEDFRRAQVVFPYQEGAIYQVDTAVEKPTTLTFAPGEEVFDPVLTGERWSAKVVHEANPVRIVLVATDPKLRTRLTIVTSLGLYTLDLKANATTSLVEVKWRHPTKTAPVQVVSPAYGVGYGLAGGDTSWRPQYVWDDGLRLSVLFSERLPSGDAPSVTIINMSGERQLINMRLHGRVMTIDRLIDASESLELRVGLGDEPGRTIHIRKTANYRIARCPGDAVCDFIQGWHARQEAIIAAGS